MSPAILAALAHPASILLGQETGFWQRVFVFEDYGELLQLLYPSIIAGAVLAVIGGVTGMFVTLRDSAFAVHGIAELSFAGAALALLIGADVVTGSLVGSVAAALLIGLLGSRTSRQQSVIGTLMPFGLGLGILFLSLYQGRSANRFSLLTGQIVSVDAAQIGEMALGAVVVVGGLLLLWRPLTFASVDPQVAAAKGVPLRALSLVYMLLLGVAVALSVQVVGALLVLALLITPAAAANRLTASPVRSVLLSVLFAEVAMVGGILLALAGSLPISPYVTTISFAIFLVCTGIQAVRRRHSASGRRTPAEGTTAEQAAADRGHPPS
ncbi:metal ABC transporter permease [Rothia kristinae]|uniref:Metal ABC transporter permease n=1 Tax=Rothia kristinae TaxID=37923 RepID=A0A7T4MTJ4_9MICC|nr:metal ABC transporter permease [Rothia kristinae]QQC59341.1 metal ABC transporter permease [Rothia kristinae]